MNVSTYGKKQSKNTFQKKRRTRIGDKIIDHLHINLSAAYFLKGNWDKAYGSLSGLVWIKKKSKKLQILELKLKIMPIESTSINKRSKVVYCFLGLDFKNPVFSAGFMIHKTALIH